MKNDIRPITIVADRFSGAYSGALFLAFNEKAHRLPEGVGGDDGEEMIFWSEGGGHEKHAIGKGATPDEAMADLAETLGQQQGFDLLSGLINGKKEADQEKPFPVFWYESNAAYGPVSSLATLGVFAILQIKEPNMIENIDGFLDRSRCSTTRQFCRKDGAPSFGTRLEHHGEQTLRMYLQEHGLLDEFLETWNK